MSTESTTSIKTENGFCIRFRTLCIFWNQKKAWPFLVIFFCSFSKYFEYKIGHISKTQKWKNIFIINFITLCNFLKQKPNMAIHFWGRGVCMSLVGSGLIPSIRKCCDVRGFRGNSQLGPHKIRETLFSRTAVRMIAVVFPVWHAGIIINYKYMNKKMFLSRVGMCFFKLKNVTSDNWDKYIRIYIYIS